MKEIGGYLEFERNQGEEFHKNCLALNTGRNCLRYLIKVRKIKKIYLPYLLCSVISDVCKEENVEIEYYAVDNSLSIELPENLEGFEYLYIINYYGQYSQTYLKKLAEKYANLIVDNVQSYFQSPLDGVDTIYTCRKYFGVSDGAYLYTSCSKKIDLGRDMSNERLRHLMGRLETSASEFYSAYQANEELLTEAPLLQMSLGTQNILKGIDYSFVEETRTQNYAYLNEKLKNMNELELKIVKGAYAYPLLVSKGKILRKELQKRKIYIPVLWPNVRENFGFRKEAVLSENILPIPCDQRYGKEDMEYLVKTIVELKEVI